MNDSNSKPKRDEKDYKVEFSFNFENIAEQVGKVFSGIAEDPHETHYQAEIDDTAQAKIKLGGGVGKFNISALDLPGRLIDVDARHVGKLEFVVSRRDTETNIRLEPQAFSGLRGLLGNIGKRVDLHTDVGITPHIPVHLSIESGLGEATIDLRGLTLTHLSLESGFGPAAVYLPDSAEGYKTHVEGGVGPVKVYLPAQNPAKIKVEGGVGPLSVVIPADADLDLVVEGGVGPVSIVVAEGTPLRVKKEGGVGPIQLPDGLRRVKDDVFQSEGYDLSGTGVKLYVEGGVGPVRVRFGDEEAEASAKKAKRKDKNDDAEIGEA